MKKKIVFFILPFTAGAVLFMILKRNSKKKKSKQNLDLNRKNTANTHSEYQDDVPMLTRNILENHKKKKLTAV